MAQAKQKQEANVSRETSASCFFVSFFQVQQSFEIFTWMARFRDAP
jgi:hypothetical protein